MDKTGQMCHVSGMNITQLQEYGLRCFIQLAKLGQNTNVVTVGLIAEREGMSHDYVAKIMHQFKKKQLIVSRRGVHGGFFLSRQPELITLYEVLQVLKTPRELSLANNFCEQFKGDYKNCIHHCDCSVRPVWLNITKLLDQIFQSIKVSDLLQNELKTEQVLLELISKKTNALNTEASL